MDAERISPNPENIDIPLPPGGVVVIRHVVHLAADGRAVSRLVPKGHSEEPITPEVEQTIFQRIQSTIYRARMYIQKSGANPSASTN